MTSVTLLAHQSTAPAAAVLISNVPATIADGSVKFHTDGRIEWIDMSGCWHVAYCTYRFELYITPCGIGPNNL